MSHTLEVANYGLPGTLDKRYDVLQICLVSGILNSTAAIFRRSFFGAGYNFPMCLVPLGLARWRVFLIQLAILACLLGFFKLYLPHLERERTAQRAAERERKIESFFQAEVEEDATREIDVNLNGVVVRRHPQRLRAAPPITEVEAALGAPDTSATDFRGGQHLTWIGTAHQLQAAFNQGRLYCLAREDRSTGYGVMVFESPEAWHTY